MFRQPVLRATATDDDSRRATVYAKLFEKLSLLGAFDQSETRHFRRLCFRRAALALNVGACRERALEAISLSTVGR